MKRITAILLALLMSFLAVGCVREAPDASSPATEKEGPSRSTSPSAGPEEDNGDKEDGLSKGYDLAELEYMVNRGGYQLTEGQDENWSYAVYYYTNDPRKSYVSIQNYIGSSYDVVIPETIEGYPVTQISALTSSNYASKTDIVTISFPDTLYFIASGVFDESTWYKSQPDGIVYAGNVVYKYKGEMPDAAEIELPDGVTGIAGHAFEECVGLAKITLPDSLIVIANSAFEYCTSLSEVRMSNNIMRITARAFTDCKSLKAVYLPKSIRSVDGAFNKSDAAVYYEGSPEEWNQVKCLGDVNVIFNADFPY